MGMLVWWCSVFEWRDKRTWEAITPDSRHDFNNCHDINPWSVGAILARTSLKQNKPLSVAKNKGRIASKESGCVTIFTGLNFIRWKIMILRISKHEIFGSNGRFSWKLQISLEKPEPPYQAIIVPLHIRFAREKTCFDVVKELRRFFCSCGPPQSIYGVILA